MWTTSLRYRTTLTKMFVGGEDKHQRAQNKLSVAHPSYWHVKENEYAFHMSKYSRKEKTALGRIRDVPLHSEPLLKIIWEVAAALLEVGQSWICSKEWSACVWVLRFLAQSICLLLSNWESGVERVWVLKEHFRITKDSIFCGLCLLR